VSFATDLRAALLAYAPLAALVADRVAQDRIEATAARPFVVYTAGDTTVDRGLSGDVLSTRVPFALQCWADNRLAAVAVADAAELAIEAAGQRVTGRTTGYDEELDLESEILTVEWWV